MKQFRSLEIIVPFLLFPQKAPETQTAKPRTKGVYPIHSLHAQPVFFGSSSCKVSRSLSHLSVPMYRARSVPGHGPLPTPMIQLGLYPATVKGPCI